MDQPKAGFSPSYRKSIWAKVAELASSSKDCSEHEALEIILDITNDCPDARYLPNELFLEALCITWESGTFNNAKFQAHARTLLKQEASRKPKRRRRFTKLGRTKASHRKERAIKRRPGLTREKALEQLADLLTAHYKQCEAVGKSVRHRTPEEFLRVVEGQLGNKPYTYRMVLSCARALHREKTFVTPISVVNAVIDRLARRANLKITMISTPTRR